MKAHRSQSPITTSLEPITAITSAIMPPSINRGSADRPLSNAEVVDKFLQNAAYAVPQERALRIRDAVLGLDEAPALALEEALRES